MSSAIQIEISIFLDLLDDYQKDDKVVSLSDQQTSVQDRPVNHKFTADWQICYQWKDSSTS